MKSKKTIVAAAVILVAGGLWFWRSRSGGASATGVDPTELNSEDEKTRSATMSEVLKMASDARTHIGTTLNDYTATFVKQESDTSGRLSEVSKIDLKVQTRLRNEKDDAPMRVYLKFLEPENVKGREVLWGADLYEGSMAVHEVGMLLGFKTIWLDPNGMIAMQGQRYPISEIGLTRLCEKLVEQGEKDRNNPDISVTITKDYEFDGTKAQLIQVRRAKPSADENDEDDFSMAEIIIDDERKLILRYRSFGWPEEGADADDLPMLESYSYLNIKANVGLTDADFDVKNPNYNFP